MLCYFVGFIQLTCSEHFCNIRNYVLCYVGFIQLTYSEHFCNIRMARDVGLIMALIIAETIKNVFMV